MADKMTQDQNMERLLDDLFAEAKTDPSALPSGDFMAQILTDAEAMQPAFPVVAPPQRRGVLTALLQSSLVQSLGGWQGAGGLVAATMTGVWIGFSGADVLTVEGLQSVLSADTDFYLSDLGGDFSFDFGEG